MKVNRTKKTHMHTHTQTHTCTHVHAHTTTRVGHTVHVQNMGMVLISVSIVIGQVMTSWWPVLTSLFHSHVLFSIACSQTWGGEGLSSNHLLSWVWLVHFIPSSMDYFPWSISKISAASFSVANVFLFLCWGCWNHS